MAMNSAGETIMNNFSDGESMIENIKEIQNTDPSVVQEIIRSLGRDTVGFLINLVIAVVIYLVSRKLIKVLRDLVKRTLEKRQLDVGIIQFLDSFLYISLNIILVFTILTTFGVTTGSIIAILGSAGLAVGLALQGSLSNFAGGVLILLLKPFKVGDYIVEDEHKNEGTVTEISVFYTKLLTVDNKVVILPNGSLSGTSVTNMTGAGRRQMVLTVGIAYDADLKKAKETLLSVLERDPSRIAGEPFQVYVDSLATSAVTLGVRMWVPCSDYWPCRWRLQENMKLALDEAGVEIPYNKLDVTLHERRVSG